MGGRIDNEREETNLWRNKSGKKHISPFSGTNNIGTEIKWYLGLNLKQDGFKKK